MNQSLGDRDELPNPTPEAARIAALNIDDAGPMEPAHQSLPRRKAGYPSGRRFLNVIRGSDRPGDEMTVVHDIFFVRFQFDFMNGPEAVQDQRTGSPDLEEKQPLPAQ